MIRWWPRTLSIALGGFALGWVISSFTGRPYVDPAFKQVARDYYDQLKQNFSRLDKPSPAAFAKAAESVEVVTEYIRRVDRDAAIQALDHNPAKLLLAGESEPAWERGRLKGVRVVRLDDSPWTDKVGFQEGDVLLAVNGRSVANPFEMPFVVRELLTAPVVDVTVERGGRQIGLRYIIH